MPICTLSTKKTFKTISKGIEKHMDTTNPTFEPHSSITVAEVASTISQSIGTRFSDGADQADNIHALRELEAQLRISSEASRGQSYVLRFRPKNITDSSIPVPCRTCGKPIPEVRLIALNFAVTDCVGCKDKLEGDKTRRK